MIQIRKNMFETNSSSTHAMVICTEDAADDVELIRPVSIEFRPGAFGWEEDLLATPLEKAAYLYTLILTLEDEVSSSVVINRLYEWLGKEGIEATFKKTPRPTDYDYYVDHGDEARKFYDYVISNKKHLMRFLFSSKSFIITGNDNDMGDYNVEELAEQRAKGSAKKIFYKGN